MSDLIGVTYPLSWLPEYAICSQSITISLYATMLTFKHNVLSMLERSLSCRNRGDHCDGVFGLDLHTSPHRCLDDREDLRKYMKNGCGAANPIIHVPVEHQLPCETKLVPRAH